jgi:hypothetical protein
MNVAQLGSEGAPANLVILGQPDVVEIRLALARSH